MPGRAVLFWGYVNAYLKLLSNVDEPYISESCVCHRVVLIFFHINVFYMNSIFIYVFLYE